MTAKARTQGKYFNIVKIESWINLFAALCDFFPISLRGFGASRDFLSGFDPLMVGLRFKLRGFAASRDFHSGFDRLRDASSIQTFAASRDSLSGFDPLVVASSNNTTNGIGGPFIHHLQVSTAEVPNTTKTVGGAWD